MPTEHSVSQQPEARRSTGRVRLPEGTFEAPSTGRAITDSALFGEIVPGRSTVRVRMPYGDVVEGRVLSVYDTPNGAFRMEFKDPRNGGVRQETFWRDQLTDAPVTPQKYNG